MRQMPRFALVALLAGLLLGFAAHAEIRVVPPPFPALPPTAALAPEVANDLNAKGYHIAEINGSGTYLITDGNYQAWAIVTNRGVVLVDAPLPLPFFPPLRWWKRSPR